MPSSPEIYSFCDPVGIGLRHPFYEEVIATDLELGWLEVHPENYFGGPSAPDHGSGFARAGGAHHRFLEKAREKYPLSLHAVGLSLGSDQPVCEQHLRQFKEVIERYQPFQISDHASWSASGNAHLNDLLPLPYTRETLEILARNVGRVQDYFGRQMLVENPSTYLAFAGNDMDEAAFMNRLAEMTGCGILLDINNIYVQAHNHGLDAWDYIDTIEARHVGEMHLAGHTEKAVPGGTLLIDTHNRPVRRDVWDLYRHAVERFGVVPTLVEWDQDFPALDVLVGEAEKARTIIREVIQSALMTGSQSRVSLGITGEVHEAA